MGEALQNIKIVQGFSHQAEDVQQFNRHAENAFRTGIQRIRQRAGLIAIVILLVLGSIGYPIEPSTSRITIAISPARWRIRWIPVRNAFSACRLNC